MRAENPAKTKRVFRFIFALALVIVIALPSLVGGFWLLKRQERVRWKDWTLSKLTTLSQTNDIIRRQLEQIKPGPNGHVDYVWAQDSVILMTNGDYVVYAFWHGANNGFVDHLFLGHGSNGRWLYSTYHFCNSMAGVLGDDALGSIEEFQKRYSVREFDGKSDVCLKHTWP